MGSPQSAEDGEASWRRGAAVTTAALCVLLGCAARSEAQAPLLEPASLAGSAGWPIAPEVIVRENGVTTVRATRVREPIRVDGRLDDNAYEQVSPIGGFIQQEPQPGAPATEASDVWVLFDDEYLYVTCRCWDSHPERIVADDMRRDSQNLRLQDNFGVGLDTFRDKRNGYLFSVSPVGGFNDIAISDERTLNMDWNTVLDAKAGRFEGGWVAEFAIPFKSLRYGPGRQQIWGINFRRSVRSKNEHSYLTEVSPAWAGTAIARFSVAATLVGLEAPAAAVNLEVKPYAIAGVSTDMLANPARTERSRSRRRCRCEVRSDEEPDGRLHLQHRLRPGRRRRGAGEPDALHAVVSREARVLPRRARCVHLRRHRRHGRSLDLLQPAHRPQQRPVGADHRRRAGHGQSWQVEPRCAEHRHRRERSRPRGTHQLQRRQRAPRRAAAQRHRRDADAPVPLHRGGRLEPGGRRGRAVPVLSEPGR